MCVNMVQGIAELMERITEKHISVYKAKFVKSERKVKLGFHLALSSSFKLFFWIISQVQG